jgi:hypothetical protein
VRYHLTKRVVIEEQWVPGTTEGDYLADLSRAVLDPTARLVIYRRGGTHLAATSTLTDRVLPPERQGDRSVPNLLVVYAADRGIIISGYQYSTLDQTSIPPEAVWLR